MEEVWKDVSGFEGKYQVSNFGRVKNSNGHILSHGRKNNGYYHVGLSINGSIKYKLVHRLVAEAFIDNPHNHLCVNHIDGDKTNNNVNNLEWCTCKYNIRHAYSNGLNNNHKRIYCNELNMYFDSIMQCAKYIGCPPSSVHNCLHGRTPKLYNKYTFKYV